MKNLSAIIIDDSEVDIIINEKKVLAAHGVESVTSFNNSTEALDKISSQIEKGEQLPDIILLDIIMPEMDGFEWLDELDDLIDDSFKPVVIILSSTNLRSHFEDFEKQRISKEFLSKPLELEKLNEIIENRIFSKNPPAKSTKLRVKF